MGRALRSARLRIEEPLVLAAAGGVFAIAILPPLVAIGHELAAAGEAFQLLADGRLWWLLCRSIGLAGAVTMVSLLAGVPLGVLFARAAFPLRRTLFAAHVAIVFLPAFLPALGWFQLVAGTGLTRPFFSEVGLVCVLSGCFAPIVTALCALGVSGVDASLEDAARIAGGPVRAAVSVLVPLARPAITLSAVLVFALALSELGVPMFLHVDVYPAVVFARLGGMDFAPGEAAVFVLPLVLIGAVLFGLERRFAGHRALASMGAFRSARQPLFQSRPAILLVALAAASASAAPLFALVANAASSGGISELVRWAGDAPWNSLRASTLAALVLCVHALVFGHALVRRSRLGQWLDSAALLAFILPSSTLGVGMVFAWNHPSTGWLYASYGILVIGFIARYSVVATRAFAAQLAHVPESLEDAARVAGAGYIRRLALIARLAPRGLLGSFLLALVFALRDLETAALFYPAGGEPLTVRIFTLEANGPPGVVSALASLHVFMTLAAAALGYLLLRVRGRA